jgi:hypothetical protein
MADENYFACEGAIVDRLKAQLTGAEIQGAPNFETVEEWSCNPPAVFVVPGGDLIDEQQGRGRENIVRQRWLAICVARNLRNGAMGDAARKDCGALVAKVLAALQGWQPEPTDGPAKAYTPLERVTGDAPVFLNGMFWFPLAFETRFVMKGG